MKRLGKILHLSKSRSLILKLESSALPRLGTRVYDSKLRLIGSVHDVFGSTSAPYVAVKPSIASSSDYVGRVLYAEE